MQRQRCSTVCTGIVLAGLSLLSSGSVHAQDQSGKDSLFAGVEMFSKGATHATDVTLDKNMLGLAGNMAGNMGGVAGKMDFVSVHEYEYPKPGLYSMAEVEQFSKRLDGHGWQHIVRERGVKETTDVCVKTDNEGQWDEMVVISAEPTELSFVHLKGHISMGDLKKLGGLGSSTDPKLVQRPH